MVFVVVSFLSIIVGNSVVFADGGCSVIYGGDNISKSQKELILPAYYARNDEVLIEGIKVPKKGLYIVLLDKEKKTLKDISDMSIEKKFKYAVWLSFRESPKIQDEYKEYYNYANAERYLFEYVLAVRECIGSDLFQFLYIFYLE